MKIALICTGSEILNGYTADTHTSFIGSKLIEQGMVPELSLAVPDDEDAIVSALGFALSRADTVLVSGGLGPTADDVTKEAAAKYFSLPLVEDGPTAAGLVKSWNRMKRSGGIMPSRFLNQCMIPKGASVIPNSCGTAPGLRIDSPKGVVILMPGPPSELKPMFEKSVLPMLVGKNEKKVHTYLFHIAGVPESLVEERMLPLISPGLSVAYCASPGHVRMSISSGDPDLISERIMQVRKAFEGDILSSGAPTIAAEVVEMLRARGLTLSTAESCTGGGIGHEITSVPGSSGVFYGGIISYANSVKESLLNVQASTLEKYGAVSSECALEMVRGASDALKTDCAVAVTGIAGPGGGTLEKPVGRVYIAVKARDAVSVNEYTFRGNRQQIREHTINRALDDLRRVLASK